MLEHDDDLKLDPPCRDVAATSCRPVAATASVELEGRVRRLERTVEQIGGVLVPQGTRAESGFPEQIMDSSVPQLTEAVVEVTPLGARAESFPGADCGCTCASDHGGSCGRFASHTTGARADSYEQYVVFPVPQIMEECVQNRTLEQIMDSRVPQIMEAVVEVLPSTPQERVQNRTQEQIADTPVPPIMEAVGEVVLRYTTGVRAESRRGADCGVFCASDRSGERAESYAGAGARAQPNTGADYGAPCASNHGGF